MTCIVSLVDKKKRTMYIGGDSLISDVYMASEMAGSKVFEHDEFLFGFSGYLRLGQIVQFSNNIPDITGDVYEFMCTGFVDWMKHTLATHGYLKRSDEVLSFSRAETLTVMIRGRIFCVESNFQIVEDKSPYLSIGSGREVAYGSLFNSEVNKTLLKKPEESIKTAIKAACKFIPSCGGRIKVISKKY